MDCIDLRSDTVTWPTAEMRQAMAEAPLGDDVYGEDPTVNRLEAEAARRLGKEDCGRGDEVILGDRAHTFLYEGGGIAALGGVHPHPVPVQPDGTLPLEAIRAAIRDERDGHFPRTRLIALENTQGTVGGIPVPKAYVDAVGEVAREHGLALHIDGARIFNAAAALGCDAAELVAAADSVSFCLSKGLCAPVGSVLVGSQAFIERARRIRKLVGGGMRQAGVLAAAGLVALERMIDRLPEDHANARLLAEGLSEMEAIEIDLSRVQSNMVFFALRDGVALSAPELAARLQKHNIRIMTMDDRRFRAVTHYWIRPEHVIEVLVAFQKELS